MSNKEQYINLPEEDSPKNGILLDGSWEKNDRSITAAAITGLTGIGALYFNVQSILSAIFIFTFSLIFDVKIEGDYFERLSETLEIFKGPILSVVTITQYFFMLLPTLWIVKKWHTKNVLKYLRIQRTSIKEVLLACLITVLCLPFCYFISYFLLEAINYPETLRNLGNELFSAHSSSGFIALVFIICITPAICEEVFFRGYIQRTLERTMGYKSFLLTGFLFGLFHMQPLSLFSLSILGILFSFFFYRSKSIIPSGAAHFTNNLIAISLLNHQNSAEEIKFFSEGNIPVIWIFLSLFCAAGLVLIYMKITRSKHEDNPLFHYAGNEIEQGS